MKDTSQVERLLTIISLLSDHNGLTIDQINKKLENDNIFVSKKTLQRDLDSISKNFYVYEEEIQKEVYYYANKYCLDKFTFSTLEVLSLYFALKLFEQYRNIHFGKCFSELVHKILKETVAIDKEKLDQFDVIFRITSVYDCKEEMIPVETIENIQNAIWNSQKIEIEYQGFGKEKTTRIVDSYFLDIYEGCYHLIGFCDVKKDIRDFRVSRIKKLKVLDATFEKNTAIEERIIQNRLHSLYSTEQIQIKLKFKKEIASYIKEFEQKKADKIVDQPDGSILFTRKTANTPELLRWILQYGHHVIVLEPPSLRQEILAHIQSLLYEYKTNEV